MAIDLRTFNSGDTDYIAKMNANVAELTNAINGLQTQAGAIPASATTGMLMDVLFNHADALVGPDSYKPSVSGTFLKLAPGGMYLAEPQTCVQSFAEKSINFLGQVAGTYYVIVDGAGQPYRHDEADSGTIYSVVWNGSGFGTITRIVPVFYDTKEASASRDSSKTGTWHTLDLRLERIEQDSASAADDADEALEKVEVLEGLVFAAAIFTIRKVGITVDGTTGVKGAIQLDFGGEIIGWSIIANTAGSLSVDVERKASAAPPAAPNIPVAGTDKISASAPIVLNSAQSAARAEAGVSTWNTILSQWDVLQFNVTAASVITKATLYLRIREIPPQQVVNLSTIASTELTYEPFVILS